MWCDCVDGHDERMEAGNRETLLHALRNGVHHLQHASMFLGGAYHRPAYRVVTSLLTGFRQLSSTVTAGVGLDEDSALWRALVFLWMISLHPVIMLKLF